MFVHTLYNARVRRTVCAECEFDGLDCEPQRRFSPIDGTLSVLVREPADVLRADRSRLNSFVRQLSRSLWLVLRVRTDDSGALRVLDVSDLYQMPGVERSRRAAQQLERSQSSRALYASTLLLRVALFIRLVCMFAV